MSVGSQEHLKAVSRLCPDGHIVAVGTGAQGQLYLRIRKELRMSVTTLVASTSVPMLVSPRNGGVIRAADGVTGMKNGLDICAERAI